jgi:hypothetical protein
MKWLCDQMLGTLAKWLRIYGFDTFYADATIDDDQLMNIAQKENRILLTRDKQLVYQARKASLQVVELKAVDLDEQLQQVLQGVTIDKSLILSRCCLCNTVLESIEKNDVEKKVPKKVFDHHDRFWYCVKCDKVYWKGSHWDNMFNTINKVKSTTSGSSEHAAHP